MATLDTRELRQRSTVELVKDLTQQAGTLVRQEAELIKVELHENVELAKTELAEKGKKAGVGMGAAAAAGAAGLLALGAFTAFLILALDGTMANWAAALCVTAFWMLVGIPLAFVARSKIREVGTPVPEKTLRSVKEDVAWLKDQTS
ncbi:MAG TPA: phage holin family protein [Solirubrobacterales bacterium]|nr:phage holin family protein [Solirubrobacterales bacterium]